MQFSLFGELNWVAAINQKQTTFFQSETNSFYFIENECHSTKEWMAVLLTQSSKQYNVKGKEITTKLKFFSHWEHKLEHGMEMTNIQECWRIPCKG